MNIKRLILILVSILLFVIIFGATWVYLLLNASLPQMEGMIEVSEINSDINVLIDAKGIPQIWTDKERDAWYALGWLHAGDRLFQMDLTRRVAYGRLSELFGELTLGIDRHQRIIGHKIIAENSLPEMQEPFKQYLASYCMGVNQWVEHTNALPFEFYLLGVEFEPWSIQDCLTILSFQTWFSNDLQNADKFFVSLENQAGRENAEDVIAPYPSTAPTTVPQNEKLNLFQNGNQSASGIIGWQAYLYQSLFATGKLPFLLTGASNAWVISGEKSQSGQAILASDPHLEISRLPQFWYVVGVHANEGNLNVFGITTPGIPFVTMGHNGNIAWAFTAGGVDVTDEYRERLNPVNKSEYQMGEKFVPFDKRWEYIKVRGRENPDSVLVKTTRHGPVFEENEEQQEVYALKWAGFDQSPSRAIAAGFNLMHATTFKEFQETVTDFAALDANWVYADKEGNIGYQLGTPIPVRRTAVRYTRLPGWDSQFDWQGYHSLEETPHVLNPQRGWLATCNNMPDRSNLNYPIFGNFADDRIQRINALLSSADLVSMTQMKDFQQDLKSLTLLGWKDEVKRIVTKLDQEEWVTFLERWDGETDIDSKETALVETWLALIKQYTFEDDFPDLRKQFINRIQYRDRNFERIYFDNHSKWFDDISTKDIIETREDLALSAMKEAIRIVGNQKWGDIQTLTMAHPMGEIPVVSSLLSLKRGPFPRSGTTGSLNNSSAFVGDRGEFIARGGPSWRFILDFNDINNIQMVIPAGQSGNPISDHFFDFYDLWFKGDYWIVPFERDRVEANSVSTLILKPKQGR